MGEHPYPDLNINGVANAAGGHYRHVSIEGMGKVIGDVRAAEMRMSGMITVQGDLEIERLDADGKFKMEGACRRQSRKSTEWWKCKARCAEIM